MNSWERRSMGRIFSLVAKLLFSGFERLKKLPPRFHFYFPSVDRLINSPPPDNHPCILGTDYKQQGLIC